jgi:hypothetical protein
MPVDTGGIVEDMPVSHEQLIAAAHLAVDDASRSRPFALRFREHEDETGWYAVLSDQSGGSTELRPKDDSAAEIAAVAEVVQRLVDVDPDNPWPPCPEHPAAHALQPTAVSDAARWVCPLSRAVVTEVGGLVDAEEGHRRWTEAVAEQMAWIERYRLLSMEAALALAQQEGRPVRVIGPRDGVRADLIPQRLNIRIDDDGAMIEMSAG